MNTGRDWIPMRWPPAWREPSLLDLLRGTPVNCLIIPGQVARDPALSPLIEQGRRAGISFVATAPPEQAPQPARPPASLAAAVPVTPRSRPDWSSASPILAVSEAVWPGVAMDSGSGVGAGPTGVPWVDSNGWFVRLATVRAPGKSIWLACDPPEKRVLPPEAYALAVADAEAYGARWIISLADGLGLAQKKPQALQAWRQVTGALEFFRAHREWSQFRPLGVLGVLSDFSGPNQDLAGEILNLLSRRSLPYRIFEKSRFVQSPIGGLKAIIDPDQQPPDGPLRRKLMAFVRSGGLLIVGPQWKPPEGPLGPGDVHGRHGVRLVGKGHLAIAKEETQDPYLVAADAHLLLSRRNDLLRLWNAGSMNAHYTVAPDGKRALVQLINYSGRPAGHPVTLGLTEPYRTARFWGLGVATPAPLKPVAAARGIELPLPDFGVYAAVELEK